MKKKTVFASIACIIVFICIAGAFKMRKDFPYDIEVVPFDQGLRVINTTHWANRDCVVTVDGDERSKKLILPASNKLVTLSGLKNGTTYKISVRRNDLIGKIKYRSVEISSTPQVISKYVTLLGASIGNSWNLRELADRKQSTEFFWGYRGLYEFDKTPLLDQLVKFSYKPDIVIIKECAAYFPRDIQKSVTQVQTWVERLLKANIEPVLATVVPITKSRAVRNPEHIKSINEFNSNIRALGGQLGIRILDLQKELSNGLDNGYLSEKYANKDGLHLKDDAYLKLLDEFIINFFVGPDENIKNSCVIKEL